MTSFGSYANYGAAIKVAKRYNFQLPEHRVERHLEVAKMKAERLEAGLPWPPKYEMVYWQPEGCREGLHYGFYVEPGTDLEPAKARILEARKARANTEISRIAFKKRTDFNADGRPSYHRYVDSKKSFELIPESELDTWGIHFYNEFGDPDFRLEPK